MSRNSAFKGGQQSVPGVGDVLGTAWDYVRENPGEVASAVGKSIFGDPEDKDTWLPDAVDKVLPDDLRAWASGAGAAANTFIKTPATMLKDLGQWSLSQATKNPFDPRSAYNASGLVPNPYAANPDGKADPFDNTWRPALEAAALFGPGAAIRGAKAAVRGGARGAASTEKTAAKTAEEVAAESAARAGFGTPKVRTAMEENAAAAETARETARAGYAAPKASPDVTVPKNAANARPRGEWANKVNKAKANAAAVMLTATGAHVPTLKFEAPTFPTTSASRTVDNVVPEVTTPKVAPVQGPRAPETAPVQGPKLPPTTQEIRSTTSAAEKAARDAHKEYMPVGLVATATTSTVTENLTPTTQQQTTSAPLGASEPGVREEPATRPDTKTKPRKERGSFDMNFGGATPVLKQVY